MAGLFDPDFVATIDPKKRELEPEQYDTVDLVRGEPRL